MSCCFWKKCLLFPNTGKPFKTLKISEFNSPIVEEGFNSGLKFHLDSSLHILLAIATMLCFWERKQRVTLRFHPQIICTLNQLEYCPSWVLHLVFGLEGFHITTLCKYSVFFSSSTSMTSFLICVSNSSRIF